MYRVRPVFPIARLSICTVGYHSSFFNARQTVKSKRDREKEREKDDPKGVIRRSKTHANDCRDMVQM